MKSWFPIAAALAVFSSLSIKVRAQDGTPQIVTSPGASPYTCNPATCTPPNCMCASKNPPGGLPANQVPQFVTVTFDDSIDEQLMETAYKLLQNKNPNGCPALGTWFVSIQYSNFSQITQWYANGGEIADHTFTHVANPPANEISSCKQALNTYAGIPLGRISGFRAPFLNYSIETFSILSQQGFTYDSSSTSVIDDAYWPYTLDNGMANDCWQPGLCTPGAVKAPGLWEIPMAAVLDPQSTPWLMDIYTSGSVTTLPNVAQSADTIMGWLKNAFTTHYSGQRAPFGVYVHPTHLTNITGLPDVTSSLAMMQSFLSWVSSQPDVWFVTNQQLLQWVKNPVPASQLASQSYMQCQQPVLPRHICNGLGDDSLTQSCSFPDTVWSTCYNCPSSEISVANPVPSPSTTTPLRGNIPTNCDTVWWDPITSTCLCNSTACAYKDIAQPKTLSNSTGSNSTAANNNNNSSSTHSTSSGTAFRVSGNSFVAMVVAVIAAILV